MSWTPWKKVADRTTWYVDHAQRFPICYELGLAKPGPEGPVDTVYAATAAGEASVLAACESGTAPVSDKLTQAIADGYEIYMRCNGAATPERGETLLAEALAAREHPWNAP